MEKVEVICKCKDCLHWEVLSREIGYCYYWTYEPGEAPNMTTVEDFCSNAEKGR